MCLRQLNVLAFAVSCLQTFTQNNWLGPCVESGSNDDEESVFQHKVSGSARQSMLTALGVDGEPVYEHSRLVPCLYMAHAILLNNRQHLTHCQTADWWLLRCLQTQQALLQERSPTLKQLVLQTIDRVLKNDTLMGNEILKDLAIQFHLEAGHLCYFYYEPAKATEHFTQALKLSALDVALTGEMGKRTRFQQTSKAQLVLQVQHTADSQPWTPPHPSNPTLPKNVSLNDDTVLEQLQLQDGDKQLAAPMSPVQQAVVLGACHQHRKTVEGHGDIVQEESMAYVNCVLSQPMCWSVQSVALLMRTQWEWNSARRMERSMAQLEELVGQFKRPEPPAHHRLPLVYCVKQPPIWEVERELAGLFERVGAISAALEVYLRLHMWENIIRCYIALGRKEKAEALIREQLAMKETPSLWCYLGDVLREEEYYLKAWELSGGHFARAQRSLGYLHVSRQEFEKALPCFEKSVKINTLQIGVWFTYGCSALACKQYDVAARAFRICVDLDPDNHEAWNNLSSAYIKTNQKSRAFTTLQEAIKCDYENWRLWENFLLVATDTGNFSDVIRAYHRMLDIRHKHSDTEVLGILVRAVTENLRDANNEPASALRTKALELFGRLTSMVTSNADIWRLYAQLLEGGQQQLSQSDHERALQYLQKSHRCTTQTLNWEKDVTKCQDVLCQSIALVKAYLQCGDQIQDVTHACQILSGGRLAVKGVLTKIKQQQLDPMTEELPEVLREPYAQLEHQLQVVVNRIAEKKS